MSGPFLAVEGVSAAIGAQPILQDVSLAVGRGEVVAILGANGAGKTSLLRCLSGVYRVGSGRVAFAGQDITNWPAPRIVAAGLCHAPEGRQIFPRMSVRDNLLAAGIGLSMRARRALADELTTLFPRLAERSGQDAGSMSGGEQQMLAIVRALMGRPKLLLLDEPSLGLAPKAVAQVFEIVATVAGRGVAVLIVEQNARAALAIAGRGYVMRGGRVVLSDAAQALAADDRVREVYLGHG